MIVDENGVSHASAEGPGRQALTTLDPIHRGCPGIRPREVNMAKTFWFVLSASSLVGTDKLTIQNC